MLKESILALVLAGGKGERLHPLTLERTKPSVPFGGKYRIIDFALSSLINSGIYSIYVLVQYKSQSLIEHIRTTWRKSGVLPKHFITVVPPQMRREGIKEWYRGTADSVYQNINLIYDFKPKIVAIFGGDHIYRMNIKQMVDFHIKNKAKLTISVVPVNYKEARKFGVLKIGKNSEIKSFKEKPRVRGTKDIYVSMGNYIFDADLLIKVLEEVSEKTTTHDFGHDIIPYLVKKNIRVLAYDFSRNRIPALRKYEEKFYWRDVGTINSYWRANMDLLGRRPLLDLDNRAWPIYASNLDTPPAYIADSDVNNSLISEGARIYGAKIDNSIVGRNVVIEDGCDIKDSIIMDFASIKRNASLSKVIVDRFNVIKEDSSIGYDVSADKKRYFVDSSGIVVLKRRPRKTFYW